MLDFRHLALSNVLNVLINKAHRVSCNGSAILQVVTHLLHQTAQKYVTEVLIMEVIFKVKKMLVHRTIYVTWDLHKDYHEQSRSQNSIVSLTTREGFFKFPELCNRRWKRVSQGVKRSMRTKPPQQWNLYSMHSLYKVKLCNILSIIYYY